MNCKNRIGEATETTTVESSLMQFSPEEIIVQKVEYFNIPVLFPFIDGNGILCYKPIFLKPRKRAIEKWYKIYVQKIVRPIFFDTSGIVKKESVGLYYNERRNQYRLMTTKFYEYVFGKNYRLDGVMNVRHEKHLVGKNYKKAKRSVYGTNNC